MGERPAYAGDVHWDVTWVDETGSTNADLSGLAARNAAEGTVLVADHQSAGRGRLDRHWVAPPGTALTFSVLLRPHDVPVRLWTWIPLLAGCAVADAVSELCPSQARLKWPNDVLFDDRKVCGILTEIPQLENAAVVVGIGLNVSIPAADLPVETATSLVVEGSTETDRSRILSAVLERFGDYYAGWRGKRGDSDASGLRTAYRERCASLGRAVRIEPGKIHAEERFVSGRARDVDTEGRLILDTREGERVFGAGDVVHATLA